MCAGARVFERVSEASDGQAAERTGSDLADHAVRALETQTAVTTEQRCWPDTACRLHTPPPSHSLSRGTTQSRVSHPAVKT